MYQRYLRCKRAYLKEIRDEAFRNRQQEKLREGITEIMAEAEEEKSAFWSGRIFRKFSRRFYWITQTEWIPFLADMSDCQACGDYKDLKSQDYCLMLRHWAIRMK